MLSHSRFSYRACPNITENLVLSPLLPPVYLGLTRLVLFLFRSLDGFSDTARTGAREHPLESTTNATSATPSWNEVVLGLTPTILLAPLLVMLSEMTCDICRNLRPERRKKRFPKVGRSFKRSGGGGEGGRPRVGGGGVFVPRLYCKSEETLTSFHLRTIQDRARFHPKEGRIRAK